MSLTKMTAIAWRLGTTRDGEPGSSRAGGVQSTIRAAVADAWLARPTAKVRHVRIRLTIS
ncbi:MAG: hypothetical protein M3O28_07230 [Actinomycetota bacterium]|nr:hypothetical protein [Actinomycetota bacterium]